MRGSGGQHQKRGAGQQKRIDLHVWRCSGVTNGPGCGSGEPFKTASHDVCRQSLFRYSFVVYVC
jgi:hypothetical protein